MRIPHPIPYQGSKRNLALRILEYFPRGIHSLYEPFAGSAAVSILSAYHKKAKKYHINDINMPLMHLWKNIIEEPVHLSKAYQRLWKLQAGREKEFYNELRDEFNETGDPELLLYLLARCVKAAVRYNYEGEFNQSPDNRRLGRNPSMMKDDIIGVSELFKGRAVLSSKDYKEVLELPTENDLVYMDPPYQGTFLSSGFRYYQDVGFDEFVASLGRLNTRNISYILSYDGRTGRKTFGIPLPEWLRLHRVEINAGRSSQATLLGRNHSTYESIYLSPSLIRKLCGSENEFKLIGKERQISIIAS
jgi:DNA adenine methylase